MAENTTAVQTIAATDDDLPAQTVTYSISGGADQAKFQVTGGNQLEFIAAPDFENPTDVGGDNVYEVQIEADDNSGLTTTQTVQVTVTDVNEAPSVALTNTTSSLVENTDTSSRIKVADVVVTDDAPRHQRIVGQWRRCNHVRNRRRRIVPQGRQYRRLRE